MNNGGDAAEQIVRLSLEGFEVAVRLTGSAAKNIATHTDKGVAKAADKKPSVKEKLDRYKAAAKAEKEAERTVPEASKEKPKTPEANRQTVHRQPKKSKKSKER